MLSSALVMGPFLIGCGNSATPTVSPEHVGDPSFDPDAAGRPKAGGGPEHVRKEAGKPKRNMGFNPDDVGKPGH